MQCAREQTAVDSHVASHQEGGDTKPMNLISSRMFKNRDTAISSQSGSFLTPVDTVEAFFLARKSVHRTRVVSQGAFEQRSEAVDMSFTCWSFPSLYMRLTKMAEVENPAVSRENGHPWGPFATFMRIV